MFVTLKYFSKMTTMLSLKSKNSLTFVMSVFASNYSGVSPSKLAYVYELSTYDSLFLCGMITLNLGTYNIQCINIIHTKI